jgi:RNA polymerase sigma-B factor
MSSTVIRPAAPRSVAPRSVAPSSVAPRSVAPSSVASSSARSTPALALGTGRQRRLPRPLQLRNARIEQYQQLVRPIALHYHHRCAEPLDDLVQVGLMGLLRAAELYRSPLKTPFDAFARPHIRGAILHYLRDTAPTVRLPRQLEEQRQQLAQLRARFPGSPSPEQLREAMGLSPAQWQRLVESSLHRRTVSLEQLLLDPEDADTLALAAGSACEPIPDGDGNVKNLLGQLESSQRAVLERVVLAGWSYRRTGEALRISPMTVQRRLRSGLARLHQLLRPAVPVVSAASAVPGC